MTWSACNGRLQTLVWKCWKLQLRQPLALAVDVAIAAFYVLVIALIRVTMAPRTHSQLSTFKPFDPVGPLGDSLMADFRKDENIIIAWSATKNATKLFRDDARKVIKDAFSKDRVTLKEFHDKDALKSYLTNEPGFHFPARKPVVLCGIILEGVPDTGSLCTSRLRLTLRFAGEVRAAGRAMKVAAAGLELVRNLKGPRGPRSWNTDKTFPPKEHSGPQTHTALYYYFEGFLTVQFLISSNIVKYCAGNGSVAKLLARSEVKLREFSFPPFKADPLSGYLEFLLPGLLYALFANPRVGTIKSITNEKEQQLRELMKIMGMPTSLYWTAWYVKTMLYFSIFVIMTILILKAEFLFKIAVLPQSDPTLIFAFLFVYMMATTSFCCMISSMFTDGTKASLVGRLMWVGTIVPYMTFAKQYKFVPLSTKIMAAFFLNSGMAIGGLLIIKSEMYGKGIQWRSLCQPALPDDDMSLALVIGILALDSVIYMLIALYLDAINAGKFGISRPWNFVFTGEYWLGDEHSYSSSAVADAIELEEEEAEIPQHLQPPATEAVPAVVMHRVSKVFDRNRVAVCDVTLTLYEGEITVLLGHNGAGKSTIMCLIAGMYTPSGGSVVVHGSDMVRDPEAARYSMGICLQHDVLFQELTVRDHLYFYCKLKGLRGAEVEAEVRKYLRALDLESKENKKAGQLSAGSRRKLVASIALCGRSKVVLLDEPTATMDPAARRSFWDLLRVEKRQRTVLLVTQCMKEADALGDRIAILARGRLQASGTPHFLKQQYGAGSRLLLEPGPACKPRRVYSLLRRHAGDALRPLEAVGTGLSVRLERDLPASRVRDMLKALEKERTVLDVRGYALSSTTMDEVYFKACKELEELERLPEKQIMERSGEPESPPQTRAMLWVRRLMALASKKQLVHWRDWALFAFHWVLPAAFLIAFTEGSRSALVSDMPPLRMSLMEYKMSETTVAISQEAENGDAMQDLRKLYEAYKSLVNLTGPSHKLKDFGYKEDPIEAVNAYVLDKFEDNRERENARTKLLVGASFSATDSGGVSLTAWYNSLPLHSAGLAINLLMKAFLRSVGISLRVVNHPMPPSFGVKVKLLNEPSQPNMVRAQSLAMTFVAAYFVLLPVKERVSKAKLLQLVSGAGGVAYWLVQMVGDGLSMLGTLALLLLAMWAYQFHGDLISVPMGIFLLIYISFGWAVLPLTYLSSFAFQQPSTGYNMVMTVYLYVGFGFFLLTEFMLTNSPNHLVIIVNWVMLFLPNYCFADAVAHSMENYVARTLCANRVAYCPMVDEDYCCPGKCPYSGCLNMQPIFSMTVPGIGRNIFFFILSGILYLLITFLIEYRHVRYLRRYSEKHERRARSDEKGEVEDSDVLEEKRMIYSNSISTLTEKYVVFLSNLTRYYKSFLAVDRLCVGVHQGEIFGLVGMNGAGKTTVFRVITGDLLTFGGEVYIKECRLRTKLHKARQYMGYCPQYDALLHTLTGRETLYLYARLKGIPWENIDDVVVELAETLYFIDDLDVRVKNYSTGTRRKLSAAIALLGDPLMVILDEPTSSLDPITRRVVWNLVSAARNRGSCVLLTTHSMDECEALCGRIAIMVNGVLRCIGTLPHLRDKFSSGFKLELKIIPPGDVSPAQEFVLRQFPGAEVTDQYLNIISFFIPKSNFAYSEVYATLESVKEELQVEDYFLGQASLDEMFQSFAKEQHVERF